MINLLNLTLQRTVILLRSIAAREPGRYARIIIAMQDERNENL